MGVNRSAIVPFLLLALGCGADGSETPADTVQSFLDAMDRSANDGRRLADAYALLDVQAQDELRQRARKAETLTGRAFEPWEMLAQGRFRLRFAPATRGGMRERLDGEEAIVTVTGSDGERADVPLVREDGRWRIRMLIPALADAVEPAGAE